MTLDEILFEWSYRCPKGYPTIVDGKFVDRDEVIILNKLLLEGGFNSIQLPEASPKKQISTDIKLTDLEVGKLLNNPVVKSLNISKRSVVVQKGENIIVIYVTNVPAGKRADKLRELAKALGGKYTDTTSSAGAASGVYANKPYNIVLKVDKEDKTDTDLKEGMSMVFANVFGIQTATTENVAAVIEQMLKALPKTEGLSETTIQKINKFLLGLKSRVSKDPKAAKIAATILNENISHGNSFQVFLDKNPEFRLERGQEGGELFTDIRRAGSKIAARVLGLDSIPADKWCPGDVYFIRRGSEDIIRAKIADAEATENAEAALTKLNSMFSTIGKFEDKVSSRHDIVAVSLKQSSAQGGKLKSAFQQYEGAKTEYNITPEEMKYNTSRLVDTITQMRKQFSSFIQAERVTDYKYDPVDLNKIKDVKILRGKYGAYKAMLYIMKYIAKKGDKLDDALVGLTAYGFGIVTKGSTPINPPFLKLIADSKGAVTQPQFFKPGRTLSLMSLTGGKKPPQIEILDTSEYGGLKVYMVLQLMGEDAEKIKYEINYRYNGGTQLTIELGKPVHIG